MNGEIKEIGNKIPSTYDLDTHLGTIFTENRLKQYIEFIGMEDAADKFECSIASVKAWRYGYREPSVHQARKIIKASNGRLDFESIYGNLDSILTDSVQS